MSIPASSQCPASCPHMPASIAIPHARRAPGRRLSAAALPLIGLIGLIGVGAGAIPAGAQGAQVIARPPARPPAAGPAAGGRAPPPPGQLRADDVQETAVSLRDAALKGTQAWSLVSSLTTEVGPRSAGSPGDRRAVAWAVRTLQGLGFSNVHTEKVTVPHWVRGEEAG